MRFSGSVLAAVAMAALMVGCNAGQPPVDSQGKTPQQVVRETYALILQGQYDRARSNFSPKFIQELITNNNRTFIDYCASTRGWRPDRLKAKLLGKADDEDLWHVNLIPGDDNAKTKSAGVVHDLYMINGKWTIVFWGDYPKTYEVRHRTAPDDRATASLPLL